MCMCGLEIMDSIFHVATSTSMETMSFYFFSATAQVFAAIIGVSALFAVFRLEQLKNRMEGLVRSIRGMIVDVGLYPEDIYSFGSNDREGILEHYPISVDWVILKKPEIKKLIEANDTETKRIEKEGELAGYFKSDLKMEMGKLKFSNSIINDLEKLKDKEGAIKLSMKKSAMFMGFIILVSLLFIIFTPTADLSVLGVAAVVDLVLAAIAFYHLYGFVEESINA